MELPRPEAVSELLVRFRGAAPDSGLLSPKKIQFSDSYASSCQVSSHVFPSSLSWFLCVSISSNMLLTLPFSSVLLCPCSPVTELQEMYSLEAPLAGAGTALARPIVTFQGETVVRGYRDRIDVWRVWRRPAADGPGTSVLPPLGCTALLSALC